jgi:hypothetical protein
MLRDSRRADPEIGDDRTGRLLALAEEFDDLTAGRVGKGDESIHALILSRYLIK